MRKNINMLQKFAAPAIIIMLWFLSSQSRLPMPENVYGGDKLAHFIAYGVLAVAIYWWFSPDYRKRHPYLSILITVLIASGYGVLDEVHQYHVPGRDASLYDWIADTLGAFTFVLLYNRIDCILSRPNQNV